MSDERLFIALDQGGRSSRAIAFDARGALVASARRAVSESRPAEDRVELDPERVFTSLEESLHELLEGLGESRERVESVGLATQRSSVVSQPL